MKLNEAALKVYSSSCVAGCALTSFLGKLASVLHPKKNLVASVISDGKTQKELVYAARPAKIRILVSFFSLPDTSMCRPVPIPRRRVLGMEIDHKIDMQDVLGSIAFRKMIRPLQPDVRIMYGSSRTHWALQVGAWLDPLTAELQLSTEPRPFGLTQSWQDLLLVTTRVKTSHIL